MKCTNCGAENRNAMACWKCGQHLDFNPDLKKTPPPKVFLGSKDTKGLSTNPYHPNTIQFEKYEHRWQGINE